MKIKKGDTVKILYGKERGKRGSVVAIDIKGQKVIVEGLNLYKRHLKGDGKSKTSEIVTIEKPFPLSKIMFVCPLCGKATRVLIKKDGKETTRICKKCGKEIVNSAKKVVEKVERKDKKVPAKKTEVKTKSKTKKQ